MQEVDDAMTDKENPADPVEAADASEDTVEAADASEEVVETFRPSADAVDLAFQAVISVLVVAVLGLSGWFGYSYYLQREIESQSSPAMRALRELEDVVREYPDEAAIRVRYGEALATAGLYEKALESFAYAIQIEPGHVGAHLDTGLVQLATEDLRAAEQSFQQVVDLTEGTQYAEVNDLREIALYQMGVLSVAEERFEDAIAYLKGALRIRRDASDTFYELALAYRGLDEPGKAESNVEIALAFDPNYSQARYLRGLLYLDESSEASAAVEFRHSLDLIPEAGPPREKLEDLGPVADRIEDSVAALEANDLKTAFEQSSIAVSIEPARVDALRLHAEILESSGDDAEALLYFERVLAIEHDDSDALEAVERLAADE